MVEGDITKSGGTKSRGVKIRTKNPDASKSGGDKIQTLQNLDATKSGHYEFQRRQNPVIFF